MGEEQKAHPVVFLNLLGAQWRLYEHEGRYYLGLGMNLPQSPHMPYKLEVSKEQAARIMEHFTDGDYTVW